MATDEPPGLLVCRKCHAPVEAHGIFHDEPTPAQLEGLVEGQFDGAAFQGLYCPARTQSDPPRRIQLSRAAGWRKPEGCISVARPSRWGNPYVVGMDQLGFCGTTSGMPGFYGLRPMWNESNLPGGLSAEHAVYLYRADLESTLADPDPGFDDLRAALEALRGHDLGCWCGLFARWCHADVLLDLANRPGVWAPTPSYTVSLANRSKGA